MLRIFLSLASALLLIPAFPRFEAAYLAWIGLVPLLAAIRRSGPASAGALAYLAGISFFMGIFSWINVIPGFTRTDFLLLGVYLGSYWGLFGLALSFLTRRGGLSPVLAAPVIWVSLEYLRSHAGFLALPWALLGQSQYQVLPVIQMAAFTGVYGISFVIVLVNALLSEILLALVAGSRGSPSRREMRLLPYALATLGAATVALFHGFWALSAQPAGEGIRTCLIQGNIPQDLKWENQYRTMILEKYCRLTTQAAQADRPALMVWPESAVPGAFLQDSQATHSVLALAQSIRTHLLLGSAQRPKLGEPNWVLTHRYNSVFLISPEGAITGYHHKIYLLPFAEYLPYREAWPWPQRLAAHAGDFIPGQNYTIFELNGIKFGVAVCWENIFPDLVRQFVARGAEFIVNVTNEAWFEDTAAPHQFVMMSVFRAVENRVTVARAANTGISCVIDPWGRISGIVADRGKCLFVEGFLTRTLPRRQQTSFYTRYGEVFSYLTMVIFFSLLLLVIFKRVYRKADHGH
ncbi:MAG: apolipoprotein N-acyltransferase [Deltaproteobacteria bacterium]|nr:apolipoprotein N-acyltransferase [Deltaproteobacteria bacterium]